MHKSKLIETLSCLKAEEIVRLEQFLLSPYFHQDGQDESVLALLRHVMRFHPEYEHPDLDRNIAYSAVFPNSALAKSRLEKTMTRLLKELHRFIALEMTQKKSLEVDEQVQLLYFFKERGNAGEYERLFQKIRLKFQAQEIKDSDYFLRLYQLEDDYCSFLAWFNDRKTDLNLQAASAALNNYYLLAQLEYAVLYLSQTKVVPLKDEAAVLDLSFVDSLLQKQSGPLEPIIEVYYKAYLLLNSEPANPQIFIDFNALLETHKDKLPEEKVKNFQALTRNYCIREFNNGHEAFFPVAFEMYKKHLEKGYLT